MGQFAQLGNSADTHNFAPSGQRLATHAGSCKQFDLWPFEHFSFTTRILMIENNNQFFALTGQTISAIRDVLTKAAEAASRETLAHFRSNLSVDNKLAVGFDPVTVADKQAERAIRAVISASFPDHVIIGEEEATKETGSDFSWIIDPIDGTRSFISGVPLWGTLIGFAYKGRVLAGLMNQPFIGETFLAIPGSALWHRNGDTKTLEVSGVKSLATSRLFTTAPELFDTPQRQAIWNAISSASQVRRFGCDCYAYCLLAAGHADIVIEPALNIYDIAALVPIVEQAGGYLTTWEGGSADQGGDIIAAASKELLDETLALIAAQR